MREIKFRAWDKEKNIMFSEFEQNDEFVACMEDKADWKHLVLMQYTGLLDINRKEIYEGDIVDATKKGYKKNIGQIIWDSTFASFQVLDSEDDRFDIIDVKVIGNIYEDSHLLQ